MANSIKQLVEDFRKDIDYHKSSRYDEANTRTDFIDWFFELLGWNVLRGSETTEDSREVIREDKVRIKGKHKSPDYSFRLLKERQFFVEAKRPSVNIHDDIKPAYQIRRYGHTAGLPISILTDFEELAIYDTRIRPNENDNASIARIFYCKYDDYEKNWDYLNNLISKQAVLEGKLKEYASSTKKKKGIQSVDKGLLELIDNWRFKLAKNIALRNKEIDIYQLNEAVQKIIDRIIFLRMAEDRNTEIYASLQAFAGKKEIYSLLVKYFTISNNKYNSGLFAIVNWLDNLTIDDKIFKSIIKDLYYPAPYEFSVLPIEILGHIYEQFLGKTIRLTQGHQAKVEEKPEVRKAGGVYYTPKYIVDYIVENTVGKKIGGSSSGSSGSGLKPTVADKEAPRNRRLQPSADASKSSHHQLQPSAIESLRILDPACGSGSFLVGAFKYLLDYHLEYYTHPRRKKKALKDGKIYMIGTKTFRLSIREKRKILLNNIYGVDIDSQAVEVTKLSLLLTLMEGEIVEFERQLFHKDSKDALLPNLENNIKCGNSLIGTDFYGDKDLQLFDMYEQRKINCFDWEDEFPEIFFDKPLKAFHITWVTHNSRVSERMIRVHANKGKPFEMDVPMRDMIVGYLENKIIEMKQQIRVLALNVLPDHVHMLMVCGEEEVTETVRKLKGYSSHELCRELKLSVAGGGKQNKIWAKSFSKTNIKSQQHLFEAIEYINNNHKKHDYPPCNRRLQPSAEDHPSADDTGSLSSGLKPTVADDIAPHNRRLQPSASGQPSAITKPEKAFEPIPAGGFDCVIGNPPYIKLQTMMESQKECIPYFKSNYISASSKNIDIYLVFLEKAFNLISEKGITGYILPHKFFQAQMGENIRKYLTKHNAIKEIISFGANQIFENATTYTCLFFMDKIEKNKFYFKEFNLKEDFKNNLRTKKSIEIDNIQLLNDKWNIFDNKTFKLFKKLNSMPLKLKDITRKIFVGLQTSADKIYVLVYRLSGNETNTAFENV